MHNKRITLSILLLISINFSLFANFGFDFGLNYSSTEVDDNGDTVESEYPFSIVALPSFSAGKLSMELNVPVFFKFDSEIINFDDSNFKLPEPQNDFTADALAYSKFFLSYINYIQWANFNEEFAIRIGKVTNSTIGDGALLYHYKDDNVGKFDTRAGLQLKLEGSKFNLPLGVEFISTDLFNPDIFGGRVYVNPIFFLNNDFINKLTLGYTVTYNTVYNDPTADYWLNFVYDIQLPMVKNANNSIITYYDLISEAQLDEDTSTINRSISQRVGLYGWYLTSFSYDAHIKNIIEDNAANDSFTNNNVDLISKAILPQLKKDFIVSANTGYYSNNGLTEYSIGSELEFNDIKLDNYNLELSIKTSKAIGPISDITAYVEKRYLKDSTTSEFGEDFITGLTTTKNITVSFSTNIIFYQVNAINIALNIESDESGDIGDPKFTFGYKFSFF